MDALEHLTKKVQQAAAELASLKKEKRQYLSEIERLRAELESSQRILKENEQARRHQDKLRTRLERLSRKIERHLISEPSVMVSSEEGHS